MFASPSRKTLRVGLAVALCLAAATAARANQVVYQRAIASTALVISPREEGQSFGTGVVVNVEKRWLLTAYHVVRDRERAVICFPRWDEQHELITDPDYYRENLSRVGVAGRVIATDPGRDLAVIQVASLPAGVRAIALAASLPGRGATVHSIGNSGVSDGALWRYSEGKVRNLYLKKWHVGDLNFRARVVESQLPHNHGDSGGPVVNDQGELVAITSGIASAQQLVAYSIDIREVRVMLEEAKKPAAPRGTDRHSLIGTWSRSYDGEDGRETARLEFRADGTFKVSRTDADGRVLTRAEGRFRLEGDRLSLTLNGKPFLQGRLSWRSKDRLAIATGEGSESVWRRTAVPAEAAAHR